MLIVPSHSTPKKMHARRNPNLSISSASSHFSTPSPFLSPRLSSSQRALLSAQSPPPSPNLPSLVPRHGKKSPTNHTQLIRRLIVILCGASVLAWLGLGRLYTADFGRTYSSPHDGEAVEYEMVGDSLLPTEPSAVIVTDKKGKPRWTVSIPSTYDFPLRPVQYEEICAQASEMSHHLAEMENVAMKGHRGYYQPDPYYLDVQDAEEQGLLPPSSRRGMRNLVDGLLSHEKTKKNDVAVCEQSLTFVMETSDAGFGNTLMELWMAYGLAQKEGRAFFVDDSRWPYGNYSTYFSPPPSPSCLPPPASHIVPCPHQAKHLIVSAATVKQTFGHGFTEEYEDPKKMEVARQHNIFGLARSGFEALFKLRSDDATYVDERVQSLYSQVSAEGGMNIGLHIRRGDRHPYEYQYSNDYLPLARYIDKARDLLLAHSDVQHTSTLTAAFKFKSKKKPRSPDSWEDIPKAPAAKVVVASDDPDIYTAPEVVRATRAQDRIVLASKTALEAAAESAGHKKNKYIDEISGWEGGFYRDVFWSLGQPASSAEETQQHKEAASTGDDEKVPGQAMQLRELVGRAYLMDLAVLSQADAVICTVSSAGCRLLAVMMGWRDAIEEEAWVNVDGEFPWRGIVW